jgi:hypothetical protein
VRYEVADEFVYAANCHCSNCRRATGSAFKPFAGIERGKFALARGADNVLIFGDERTHDAHCKTCGSLLYSLVRDDAFVHVAMGALVDDPTIRATHHIFVGSKAPWFTITDDLPQYDGHVGAQAPQPMTDADPLGASAVLRRGRPAPYEPPRVVRFQCNKNRGRLIVGRALRQGRGLANGGYRWRPGATS